MASGKWLVSHLPKAQSDIDGLANKRWVKVESPFGAPSDELRHG